MHILIAVLGALGALAFWIIRAQMAARAARDLADVAGEVANLPRKMRFQRAANKQGLGVITDPREAATAILALTARAAGDLSADVKEVMRDEMAARFKMASDDAEEMLQHVLWLTQPVADDTGGVRRMTRLVAAEAGHDALLDVMAMMKAIAAVEGGPTDSQQALIATFKGAAALR